MFCLSIRTTVFPVVITIVSFYSLSHTAYQYNTKHITVITGRNDEVFSVFENKCKQVANCI